MTKTLTLRSFDVPQLHKFGIGFDSMLDELMRVTSQQTNSNYPPHNVIKTGEDTVTIEVAVAGFAEGEINIALEKRLLTIAGASQRDENAAHE
jgi:molecular chaperone IbpA